MIEIMKLRNGEHILVSRILNNYTYIEGCRRYRTMESAANRLQKEAKGYLDSLRGEENIFLGGFLEL